LFSASAELFHPDPATVPDAKLGFSNAPPRKCRARSHLVVTLGLFLLVLNGIVLWLVAWVVPGFRVDSFGWAVVGALVLTVISFFTSRIGESRRER